MAFSIIYLGGATSGQELTNSSQRISTLTSSLATLSSGKQMTTNVNNFFCIIIIKKLQFHFTNFYFFFRKIKTRIQLSRRQKEIKSRTE